MTTMISLVTYSLVLASLSTCNSATDDDLLKQIDTILSALQERHVREDATELITEVIPTEKRRFGMPTHNSDSMPDRSIEGHDISSQKRGVPAKYNSRCREGYVSCGPGQAQCIKATLLCDGFVDCDNNGWDENASLCGEVECMKGKIKCNGTGTCISRHDMCDDVDDCGDMEDENTDSCGVKYCEQSSSKCPSVNMCVDNKRWCDGDPDCPNGEDEIATNCQLVPCNGVRCGNGACISSSRHCDGFPDCDDGSDEDINICGPVKCRRGAAQCGEANYCYRKPYYRTCDGTPDCPNGADERKEACPQEEAEPQNWYSYRKKKPKKGRKDALHLLNEILKYSEQ